jgi:hypothetical protein
MDTGLLAPLVKQPEREVNQLLLYSAEVKNSWSYTSAPLCAFFTFTGTTLLNCTGYREIFSCLVYVWQAIRHHCHCHCHCQCHCVFKIRFCDTTVNKSLSPWKLWEWARRLEANIENGVQYNTTERNKEAASTVASREKHAAHAWNL